MSNYRERVVNIALDELGRCYGARYEPTSKRTAKLWCGMFVIWVLKRAELLPTSVVIKEVAAEVLCKLPRCTVEELKPGDILRDPITEHFSIIEEVAGEVARTINGSLLGSAVNTRLTELRGLEYYSIKQLINARNVTAIFRAESRFTDITDYWKFL